MSYQLENETYSSFGLSGKLGSPAGCGMATAGQARCGGDYRTYGIWQMRNIRRGKVPVKMKFYTPTNPRSVAQQANRQKFANAQAAWMALTPPEKLGYTTRAKRRSMFGWGLFIREYYQEN